MPFFFFFFQKGVSHTDKLASLRKDLEAKKVYGTVISALDEVAWLFNLRGSDVECNPVFFSYAIVTLDQTTLYVDHAKLGDEVLKHLGDQVSIKPYNDFFVDLKGMASTLSNENKKLLINSKTSLAVEVAIQKVMHVYSTIDYRKQVSCILTLVVPISKIP